MAETVAERRDRARSIFEAGVAGADPYRAVARALREAPLPEGPPPLIVAVGKAARAMARAALEVAPDARTLVVTNYENAADLDGARVFAAGHPVPDENGQEAAEAVIAALDAMGAGDHVLALISGGGSALLPAPVEGVSLADKAELSRLLLGAGAEIGEMNLVRQQVSRLKGGGMLRHAAPACVRALILSDVVGDDLSAIASGPTAPPLGTPAEAKDILRRFNVWDRVPEAIRAHLDRAEPPLGPPAAQNTLVGSNGQSVARMAEAAPGAHLLRDPVTGDVADAARKVMAESEPGVTLWGGETTVTLRGDGRGGRNQEMALRIALMAEAEGWPEGWVCLQAGTDGRDGPTDAAGAIVDAGTPARIRAAGGDPEALLANNDSYAALELSGDLLITGGTGTNVADLGVMIRP